jgi:hypothetical protein
MVRELALILVNWNQTLISPLLHVARTESEDCTLLQYQFLERDTALQAEMSLDFPIDLSFQKHYGPGVNSASNRNEYQKSSWG